MKIETTISTRIAVGIFPLIWAGMTYGIYLDHKAAFPNLYDDYFFCVMLGLMLGAIFTGIILAFVKIVILGKDFP